MAGIYIHIPFCKSRCIYCDYFTSTNEAQMNQFVDALQNELVYRKDEMGDEKVSTLFFGGGTPSRLHQNHFEQIFNTIKLNYSLAQDAEITIEANPDDLSKKYIDMLSDLPFNRLSIGIQSFNDPQLRFLSRRHNAQEAIDAVKYCQKSGFNNISVDLMYGLPHQTLEMWSHSIDQAIGLNVQHISAYHLIYEDKTRLYSLLQAGKVNPLDEESSLAMFEMLINKLTHAGFTHYEVSNFAKGNLFSKHNTSYWRGVKYLGFGPAAHSFDGEHRSWNIDSLPKYIEGINKLQPYMEKETIDLRTRYNEYIITRLRTMWGIDLKVLASDFGEEFYQYFHKNAEKYFRMHYLMQEETTVKLTHKGIFISDGIVSDLLKVDQPRIAPTHSQSSSITRRFLAVLFNC